MQWIILTSLKADNLWGSRYHARELSKRVAQTVVWVWQLWSALSCVRCLRRYTRPQMHPAAPENWPKITRRQLATWAGLYNRNISRTTRKSAYARVMEESSFCFRIPVKIHSLSITGTPTCAKQSHLYWDLWKVASLPSSASLQQPRQQGWPQRKGPGKENQMY